MTTAQFREKFRPTEHQIQARCVDWFRRQYPHLSRLLFAIPNGAMLQGSAAMRSRHWKKLEREGAVAGAADLFLAIPSGSCPGLFIEMKRGYRERNNQSDDQKAFEAAVVEAGYGYALWWSEDQFRTGVARYLEAGEY